MLKLITLDLDNTLWNVTPTLINAEKILALWVPDNIPEAIAFYNKENLMALRKDFCKANPEKSKFPTQIRKTVLERCFLQSGLNQTQAREGMEKAFSVFIKERNAVELFPETLGILQSLSEKYKIIALTNGNADLSMIGIEHFFTAHYSAESTGKAKPDITMFAKAIEAVGCTEAQALHIGDHYIEDIGAATTAGFHSIWFNHNNKHPSSLCKPTIEIHTLDKLLNEIGDIETRYFN